MEDWDEFDDELEDEDEDEASEDQLAAQAFDAFMDVEGDSDVAQASREALAAITDSAMALKARRQAREQREALEQAADRERLEALARREDERARQEARERAERRAEAERQERVRLAQEAQHLARERERLRVEQDQFEASRRKEKARRAASKQAPAHIPARIPIEPERPARVEPNEVHRRRFHGQAQARRPAEQGRQAVPVREDEASKAARQQQRAHDERKWREAVRRDEEARKARRERIAALAAQEQPIAIQPPVRSQEKSVKRHKAGGRRSGATTRRAKRPALHAVPASRPAQTVPPSPPRTPRRPSTPCSDRQRVASDLRATVASATADREKRSRQTEPPALRPIRPDRQAALTGADLANWRSRIGLTQQAAASRLGVGQGTISKAESKGTVPLGPALLRALAAALAQEHRTA